MHRIAVIGAGQLGNRHLQALARVAVPSEISVIDPSPTSLALAKQRFEEMPANAAVRAVHYGSSVDELPGELDYVVVATTADVRLAVLQSLLARSTVRFMLLEKVLFQRLGDYAVAVDLLRARGVRAWVSCFRRIFPSYANVLEFFGSDPVRSFDVTGGGWGLGGNSIHFLDLLGKLTGELPGSMSTADLDPALIPSKRRSFMEFTGVLRGRFGGGARFALASLADSSMRPLITIRSESRSCVIDERGGTAFFTDGKGWEQRSFSVPFLSEFATSVATGILTDGACELSTYELSAAYHLPLLTALGAHAATWHGTPADHCPIT